MYQRQGFLDRNSDTILKKVLQCKETHTTPRPFSTHYNTTQLSYESKLWERAKREVREWIERASCESELRERVARVNWESEPWEWIERVSCENELRQQAAKVNWEIEPQEWTERASCESEPQEWTERVICKSELKEWVARTSCDSEKKERVARGIREWVARVSQKCVGRISLSRSLSASPYIYMEEVCVCTHVFLALRVWRTLTSAHELFPTHTHSLTAELKDFFPVF